MSSSSHQRGKPPSDPLTLMYRVYKYVLPEVDAQLTHWIQLAEQIPDAELRQQAIASIKTKRFHCEGGAIYAAANLAKRNVLIPLIVALQTISDYLDNLCDRSTSLNPEDFRQLHLAMRHAVDPHAKLVNYYAFRPEQEDGGYLHQLVETCQTQLHHLPSYPVVQSYVNYLVELYSELQIYKHIKHEEREQALLQWWSHHQQTYPELSWNEFAAATGSTLGMFRLFLAATDESLHLVQARAALDLYFPSICGLHILLDYLIDREEDRLGGDLNFCEYYQHERQVAERIGWMARQARLKTRKVPEGKFHRMVVEGLIALYLSDPKVKRQPEVKRITRKLMRFSPMTRIFFWMNSSWIRSRQGRSQP